MQTGNSHLAVVALFLVAIYVKAECATINAEVSVHDDGRTPVNRVDLLQQFSRHNFLIGVASVGADQENNTDCGRQLNQLLNDVLHKEYWTIKLLDSFGAPPQAFNWGNYFWMGLQDLCEDLNTPFRITFSEHYRNAVRFNVTSPFPMRFTVVYMNFSTPHYIDLKLLFENLIHVGLCFPASCSPEATLNYTDAFFRTGVFDLQQNFQLQMQAVDVRTPSFQWTFFKHTGCMIFIILAISVTLLAIAAELIHRSKINLNRQRILHMKSLPMPMTIPISELPTQTPTALQNSKSLIEEALLCFRLEDNWKQAIRVDNGKHFIAVLAGIRTIICLWVTVFHSYYFALFAMSNAPLQFAKLEQLISQPILQAYFYVDVFFVISALLLVHNFISNDAQLQQIRDNKFTENLKLFLRMICRRYMRFTPVVIVTMLISDTLFDFLNMYTPFHLGVHSGIYCKRNWWHNLLYIQNLFGVKDMCCSWTWYLSCEMQFFILFTVLLFVYAKNANLGKITFVALTLASVGVGFMCNYRNGITFQPDAIHTTFDELYIAPWVRIIPYFGGAALGWLLHHIQQSQQQQQQQEHKQHTPLDHRPQQHADNGSATPPHAAAWRAACWIFCFILYITTNFMSYYRHTPTIVVAVIMSLGKLLFALCVPGTIIVLCTLGYGHHLNAFLSARLFLFLNKFCYSIYMLAPVVIIGAFGLRNVATSFTEISSGMDFLANVMLSIAGAFLVVLLVELPWMRLTNVLLAKQPKRINSKL